MIRYSCMLWDCLREMCLRLWFDISECFEILWERFVFCVLALMIWYIRLLKLINFHMFIIFEIAWERFLLACVYDSQLMILWRVIEIFFINEYWVWLTIENDIQAMRIIILICVLWASLRFLRRSFLKWRENIKKILYQFSRKWLHGNMLSRTIRFSPFPPNENNVRRMSSCGRLSCIALFS